MKTRLSQVEMEPLPKAGTPLANASSVVGHKRRFPGVGDKSAYPLKVTVGASVPKRTLGLNAAPFMIHSRTLALPRQSAADVNRTAPKHPLARAVSPTRATDMGHR